MLLLEGEDDLSRQVSHVFGGSFVVARFRNPRSAIGMLSDDPDICAIITEQVMRGADGVVLLESIRTMRPSVRRIMVTRYPELAGIVDGVKSGAIQALVQKPATDTDLLVAVFPEMANLSAATTIRRASA
jgi:DNA-binding NtrC family response regulator